MTVTGKMALLTDNTHRTNSIYCQLSVPVVHTLTRETYLFLSNIFLDVAQSEAHTERLLVNTRTVVNTCYGNTKKRDNSITHLDFYSSVITNINLTTQMKIMTNYRKRELNLKSSVIPMLNITAQQNISAAHKTVFFKSINSNSWGNNLQAL
jgi:hypothetical protein